MFFIPIFHIKLVLYYNKKYKILLSLLVKKCFFVIESLDGVEKKDYIGVVEQSYIQ